MSGHVFVVGADLTRLSCDDVLVPTDRTLRVSPSWCPLLPGELVAAAGLRTVARRPAPARPLGCGGCACSAGGCGSA